LRRHSSTQRARSWSLVASSRSKLRTVAGVARRRVVTTPSRTAAATEAAGARGGSCSNAATTSSRLVRATAVMMSPLAAK